MMLARVEWLSPRMLSTMCARASESFCNGSGNTDFDVTLTDLFAKRVAREARLYMDLSKASDSIIENRASLINELNTDALGYNAVSS